MSTHKAWRVPETDGHALPSRNVPFPGARAAAMSGGPGKCCERRKPRASAGTPPGIRWEPALSPHCFFSSLRQLSKKRAVTTRFFQARNRILREVPWLSQAAGPWARVRVPPQRAPGPCSHHCSHRLSSAELRHSKDARLAGLGMSREADAGDRRCTDSKATGLGCPGAEVRQSSSVG